MRIKVFLPTIWVLSSALIFKLATSWSQLPDRVAVHFNIKMQPNGWSSRETLGISIVLAVLGQAALATWLLLRLGNAAQMGGVILLAVNVVLVCAFWQVINYNTQGAPFQPLWIFVPLIALFAGLAVFLAAQMLPYARR
jgi:hypothetical protein